MTAKIEKLDELLKGHINGKILKCDITRLTAPGENFLSLIMKVDITVRTGDKEDMVHAVAKFLPTGHFGDPKFSGLGQITFNNEIQWYDKVVPMFKAFEKEYGVEGLTDIYPKYYGGRLNLKPDTNEIDRDAVVLLENLRDYANGDRLVGFNFEDARETLRALAQFHGIPIAFRYQKRKMFDEKILPLINISLPPPPSDKDKFGSYLMETLQEDTECYPLITRVINALKNDPFVVKDLNTDFREPWVTTVHNDFWTNNMMLKKTPGTPKVKIVDFQTILFKSFAVDVVFFLLTSIEDSVQETKMDELVRYYYDELINVLKQFKVNTNLFTYEDYLKELEHESKQGGQYAHAARFINIIFAQRGTVPDIFAENNKTSEKIDIFEDLMAGKGQRQKQKNQLIAKVCAQRNWI